MVSIRWHALAVWIALVSVSIAMPARAGVISIQTIVTTTFLGKPPKSLDVEVTLINKGDEAAHSVVVEAELPNSRSKSAVVMDLAPGSRQVFRSTHTLSGIQKGRYPLTVLVRYADANGYPFSALTVTTVSLAPMEPTQVTGQLLCKPFSREARAVLQLKNMDEQPIALSLTMRLLPALSATPSHVSVILPPRSEKRIPFHLENISALPQSSSWAYAILESDRGGLHETFLVPALISITAGGLEMSSPSGVTLLALAGVGVILAIVARVWWGKKQQNQSLRQTQKSSTAK